MPTTTTRKKKLTRVLVPLGAVVAGAGVSTLFPAAAQAHSGDHIAYTGVGSDRGIVRGVYHDRVYACNTVGDGHAVVTHYVTRSGRQSSVRDSTVDSSCASDQVSIYDPVVKFKVCTEDVYCTPWRSV